MGIPGSKAALIDEIRRERDHWEALLAEVGEDRMTLPNVAGDWSFKDLTAHLTAWRQRAVARLDAARLGGQLAPPPWKELLPTPGGDVEPINQWIYRANRERPLEDVLREARESLDRLEEGVRDLPEEALFDRQRFDWMQGAALAEIVHGNSMEHFYNDHEPEIRVWLAMPSDAGPA